MADKGVEHRPTPESRKLVAELYACGIKQHRIAERFDISLNTLNKHYKKELDDNKEEMASELNKSLYIDALEGNQQAREFWLKCQARWSYAKNEDDAKKEQIQLTLMEKIVKKLEEK
jgi:plasmid maintenance system antidote protein VapI